MHKLSGWSDVWKDTQVVCKSFTLAELIACAEGMAESYMWYSANGYSLTTDDMELTLSATSIDKRRVLEKNRLADSTYTDL